MVLLLGGEFSYSKGKEGLIGSKGSLREVMNCRGTFIKRVISSGIYKILCMSYKMNIYMEKYKKADLDHFDEDEK